MLCDCFKSRRRLEAEILVLRHQINILQQRAARRLRLRWAFGAAGQFSGAPNPVSRTGLYEGHRPLLCVRAAYISFRLASRPFGATGAQIKTLHGTVVVLRLGTYGLRRAIMSGT